MTVRLPGARSRRPNIAKWRILTGTALALLVLPSADLAIAAAKTTSTMLASAVPMPRPSPLRAARAPATQTTDAIGSLITGAPNEAAFSEDSDAPQVQESLATAPVPMPSVATSRSTSPPSGLHSIFSTRTTRRRPCSPHTACRTGSISKSSNG
jgi:hypothetical protein